MLEIHERPPIAPFILTNPPILLFSGRPKFYFYLRKEISIILKESILISRSLKILINRKRLSLAPLSLSMINASI